jgi:hypothetical protein
MKAHFVFRKLTAVNGSSILHPLGITSDEHVMREMIAHAEGFHNDIGTAKVVMQTKDGPRAVMTVAQLLVELGVHDLGIATMSGECKDSSLVVPRNLVAIQ